MTEIALIIVTGFAILGAYFLTEVVAQLTVKKNCRQLLILFAPQSQKLDVETEVRLAQSKLPDAEVLVYTADDTPFLTANGIQACSAKNLVSVVSEYIENTV